MIRKSIKLQKPDWASLDKLAEKTESRYLGKPSWRNMILRIARGEINVEEKNEGEKNERKRNQNNS